MHRYFSLGLIAVVGWGLQSCEVEEERAGFGEPIEYAAVDFPSTLDVRDPGTEVFRSWRSWAEFWNAHPECSNGCVNPAPYVDFETEMVIGVYWGWESYGCLDYSQRVVNVLRDESITTVNLTIPPEHLQGGCAAITYPVYFLRFSKASGPVFFRGVVPGQ